jgi:DNA helicase-2/ATP-dependent DNA helicase PcrA
MPAMPELNEPQMQAVTHGEGPLLVFAGAGSGKTRTIIYRIANLLASGVPPYRILAVTFTNKAAGEMKSRLSELAGPEVTRDLWVGTFHSVCAKLLRRYSEEVGLKRNFVIYDDSDQ